MRKTSRGYGLAALLVYAFLYLPLVIVVAYSFNDSRLNAEWVGFTLHWYQVLFTDERDAAAPRSIRCSSRWQPA